MNLRDWRRAEGKTVDDVAAGLQVTTDTVYRWEQGKLIPRRATMARITVLTGGAVRADDFFDAPANDATGPSAA